MPLGGGIPVFYPLDHLYSRFIYGKSSIDIRQNSLHDGGDSVKSFRVGNFKFPPPLSEFHKHII